jgi:3-oxoacyl-[acyl-carrier-protein] synthase II
MVDRRVVVTGMGAVTPVGVTPQTLFDNLMHGHSGVADTTRFDVSRCPVKRSGEIRDFDATSYGVTLRDLRTLDRYQQYVLAAAQDALADAGLYLAHREITSRKKSDVGFERFGAAVGVAFSSTEVLARQLAVLAEKGTRGVTP